MRKSYYVLPIRHSAILLIFLLLCGLWTGDCRLAMAEDKTWSGAGDGTNWSDDDNWFPAAEPTSEDDVLIDMKDALAECNQIFRAKSLTIGGRETSTLTINNFIFGTIAPDLGSDIAILNRRGGTFMFKGSGGIVTVKGQYKDSNESLVLEPSFMFWSE